MSAPVFLEELFGITNESFSTGTERLDGFIIGLATLLLIRNAEFVVFDILTIFFGDRKHKVSFRVLRTWQMLNLNAFISLITGFDSDIPCTRFRLFRRKSVSGKEGKRCRFKVRKGALACRLFVAVLCGKLLVLTAEVAIIAFLIPTDTIHTDPGGLSIVWRDVEISESDLQNGDSCRSITGSRFLTDFAQVALCKRVSVRTENETVDHKWPTNETLRMERLVIPPDQLREAGANIWRDSIIECLGRWEYDSPIVQEDPQNFDDFNEVYGFGTDPTLTNDLLVGELVVEASSFDPYSDFLRNSTSGVTPIFMHRNGMLRLSFSDWNKLIDGNISTPFPTVNGKLLAVSHGRDNVTDFLDLCPAAVDEIVRVTGTLSVELIVDILRFATGVVRSERFLTPTAFSDDAPSERGFVIGVSRRFPIEPRWIALSAVLTIFLSAVTGYFNRTEIVMGRVYREYNEIMFSCSPIYLEEEKYLEPRLFRSEENYRWGKKPDLEWHEVTDMHFTADAVLT
eukprot:GFKZ01009915.1.p1 GENE.GFKZ01009915.1~~GFKZ01009915.1.p1  ORF type:complete len:512 (+),score=46.54 GFKZ01009915.1:383-1918(+)